MESDPSLAARMLNEAAYCPRLCYLEWVQGELADNADTVEGGYHHRAVEASHLVLFGGIQVSRTAIHELCQRGVPIWFLSHGGWLYGIMQGLWHKNVELRRRQNEVTADPIRSLALAPDLTEEFRPLIGDSVVLTAVNNGEVQPYAHVCFHGLRAMTAPLKPSPRLCVSA